MSDQSLKIPMRRCSRCALVMPGDMVTEGDGDLLCPFCREACGRCGQGDGDTRFVLSMGCYICAACRWFEPDDGGTDCATCGATNHLAVAGEATVCMRCLFNCMCKITGGRECWHCKNLAKHVRFG